MLRVYSGHLPPCSGHGLICIRRAYLPLQSFKVQVPSVVVNPVRTYYLKIREIHTHSYLPVLNVLTVSYVCPFKRLEKNIQY